MVVAVDIASSSVQKAVPERLEMGNSNNDAENSRNHNQIIRQGSKRRHEKIRADTEISTQKARKQKKLTMQELYNDDYEDDEEDSDWKPVSEPPKLGGEADTEISTRKAGKQKELTIQDLCNNNDELEDDEEDSDWEPFSEPPKSSAKADTEISTQASKGKELTMQDVYNKIDEFVDEEDDSDWEPFFEPHETVTWFCTNCTMANLDNVHHCDTCGEHKESGILKRGFFSSPFLPDDGNQAEPDVKENCEGLLLHDNCEATAIGFDERMLLHTEVELKSHPHPERPDRLRAIAASLATAGIYPGRCYLIPAREITQEELQQVHTLDHIEAVDLTSHTFSSYFTSDTYANEHSSCAARLAAGLCADLSTAIFSGKVKNGFALVRPPGHHAGMKHSMGFCLHNNAAIAALAAQVAGAKKVLIIDWDVHHGNGTQEIFERSKSVLYISLHRHERGRFYPGTGAANEVGSLGGEGFCVNIPWNRGGVGDNDYMFAFQNVVLPIATKFAPDFVIVSAGFDAARGDPLGCCDITPSGYAQMTHMLSALAGGKLLVVLEGGYNLRSISSSATAVIKVLLGESSENELENCIPSKSGLMTVLEVLNIQKKFWPIVEPALIQLQSQWGSFVHEKKRKRANKRRQMVLPFWWKWGRKSLFYRILQRRGRRSSSFFRI